MPPKPAAKTAAKPAPKVSASRDLVPVGPREVIAKHHGRRNEDGQRPSTARALVLRNGKHGARGTGEVILLNKMSGREKFDLLAGTSALSPVFNRAVTDDNEYVNRGSYGAEQTRPCDSIPLGAMS